jgi:glucose/arabinose dehydrogenase
VERGGVVKIIGLGGVTRPKPFVDISSRVNTGNPKQGLHSIAFHPDFERNGRYFLHYNDKNGAAVVTEFKGASCKPRGKVGNKVGKRLFTIDQDYPNNNAGWIGFGPDRKLYIPLGDGGGAPPGDRNGVGQTPSTRLSKVLRVDVDRGDLIAADNPYVRKKNGKFKSRDGFVRETWAWGLRDPRRSSFDRETGDFWIGDVGGLGHEEVNLVPAGSVTKKAGAPNFGWSHVEGESTCHPANAPNCDPDDYVAPVYAYDSTSPQEAITGGYVYRGQEIPALQGVYLFTDFRSGNVWGLDAEAVYEGFDVPAHLLLDAPQGFVSFGEDDNGELYLVALRGSIFRLGAEQR